MGARLPLQVGRASLGQSTRFASTVWLGVILMLVGPMLGGLPASITGVMMGLALLVVANEAAEAAARDRPSDVVFETDGVTIEGGPLDGKRYSWAEVERCTVVDGEPRHAFRWAALSLLAANQIGWLARRARIDVTVLQLPGHKRDEPVVLAEAEGDERESLLSLRDAILGASAPHDPAVPVELPQEILKCPGCAAAQVPVDAPTMPCPYCAQVFDVPDELRERLRARRVLDTTAAPTAKLVAQLVGQPGARRAASVVLLARRVMVWFAPIALIGAIVMIVHSTSSDGPHNLARISPSSDDPVLFYDLGLMMIVIAATFAITWTIGSVYLSYRRTLRIVAEGFGAVPPIAAGAPSTCRKCNAPLPGTGDVLLVHCVYCAAENVLGVDPRPAAFRRTRDDLNLGEALQHRRRARRRVAIAVPLAVVLGIAVVHEVIVATHIPPAMPDAERNMPLMCTARCGTITNTDWLPHVITWHEFDVTERATVMPHGSMWFYCQEQACRLEVGSSAWTTAGTELSKRSELRIERGMLVDKRAR